MTSLPLLNEYGPLDITDLNDFLIKSKKDVLVSMNSKIEKNQFTLDDLIQVQAIGIGSFGKVMLMVDKKTNEKFAMKAIDKQTIVKTKQVEHILNEKRVLYILNFPFITRMIQFLQDNSYLYYVLPFVAGGDMFTHLQKLGKFDEGLARFYTAQLVLALEYLHFLDLIYRDLKPENILIDHTGYLKLTDFGFCKLIKSRTWTLCGTPEYLAPEVLLNKGYCKSVDWWAFGVLLYEMVAGRSPFFAKDQLRIYKNILNNKYSFPPTGFSPELKELIKNILQNDLSLRYGNLKNGVDDIKTHQWYRPTDWLKILNRKVDPPYVPKCDDIAENFLQFRKLSLKISETNRFVKEFSDF